MVPLAERWIIERFRVNNDCSSVAITLETVDVAFIERVAAGTGELSQTSQARSPSACLAAPAVLAIRRRDFTRGAET